MKHKTLAVIPMFSSTEIPDFSNKSSFKLTTDAIISSVPMILPALANLGALCSIFSYSQDLAMIFATRFFAPLKQRYFPSA